MSYPIFLSSKEIKEAEEHCFQNGMPAEALMEKAGLRIAEKFQYLYPLNQFTNVGIFVGPGHNGGDALVLARELLLSGYNTFVYLAESNLKKLTAHHLKYYEFLGGKLLDKLENIHALNVLVDGLFGFGLSNNLEPNFISLIEFLNASELEIVALDVPSGMNSDYGNSLGACIKATHTFCLGVYKPGFIQDHAVDNVGKLHFIDIGITQTISSQNSSPILGLTEKTFEIFPKNAHAENRNLNKYTNGVCLLFAGSNKYPGAAVLAAKGSLASGVGYTVLCCTDEVKFSSFAKIPDVVFHELNNSLFQIQRHIHNPNFAILCGAGVEQNDCLQLIIENILRINKNFPCLILDAACLTRENFERIKEYKGPKILTPHMGEFAKLFPLISERMMNENSTQIHHLSLNKIDAVKMAAKEIKGIVLLKGPHTVIANELGETFVDIESTNALSRAGCGDVLSGFMTGLVAKGYTPLHAACFAVYTQSKNAIDLEKKFGRSFVSASNLLKAKKLTLSKN